MRQPAKVFSGLFLVERHHGDLQPLTDGLGDVAERHAFLLHGVVDRDAMPRLLHNETVQTGHVGQGSGSPTVCALVHVGGHTLLASRVRKEGHEALLARVMHLRQAHDAHADTPLGCGARRLLRLPRNGCIAERRIAFQADVAGSTGGKPGAGGDHQQRPWCEHGAERLNCVTLVFAVLGKLRHVIVIEREVDHRIHACRAAAQAVEILDVAAMHLGTDRPQLLRARIAARQTAHLMPCSQELLHQLGPDKSCGSRYENAHKLSLLLLLGAAVHAPRVN